jgi:hypothetical protein
MISIESNPGFAFCSAERNMLVLWMLSRSRARDATYLKGSPFHTREAERVRSEISDIAEIPYQ